MANYRDLFYKDVMALDRHQCVYCGVFSEDLSLDHFIPQVKGGPDCLDNLYACCTSCNSKKQHRSIDTLKMIPRYGRFKYITDWASTYTPEKAPPVKHVEQGLAYWLWKQGAIPTEQAPTKMLAWVINVVLLNLWAIFSFAGSALIYAGDYAVGPLLAIGTIFSLAVWFVGGIVYSTHQSNKRWRQMNDDLYRFK